MNSILQAISFLTILPVGRRLISEDRGLARSMAFFPLVGLLIGLMLCAGYYLLSLLFQKPLVIWLTLGLLALLTRGFHLDGLADTVDGLASGGTKEKILEVMRDSRIGPFGVMSLIMLIGAKYLALVQIPTPVLNTSMVLMTVMGRNSMVLVCFRSPYVRSEGLGKPFAENLHFREMAVSLLSAFGMALLLTGTKGILVFLGVVFFSLGYRFFFIKRLGGITGDILGAANELNELLSILLLVILERIDIV